VECEPLIGSLPDQPPEAKHDVAFAAFHVSIALVPVAMVLGLAMILTVGDADFTETVADCVALPAELVQVKV
jgi:hypothetical protein